MIHMWKVKSHSKPHNICVNDNIKIGVIHFICILLGISDSKSGATFKARSIWSLHTFWILHSVITTSSWIFKKWLAFYYIVRTVRSNISSLIWRGVKVRGSRSFDNGFQTLQQVGLKILSQKGQEVSIFRICFLFKTRPVSISNVDKKKDQWSM